MFNTEPRQQSQRRAIETHQEHRSIIANESETKVATLQFVLRILAYFNRATVDIINGHSKEALIRQQTTLKSKVNKVYSLIEEYSV